MFGSNFSSVSYSSDNHQLMDNYIGDYSQSTFEQIQGYRMKRAVDAEYEMGLIQARTYSQTYLENVRAVNHDALMRTRADLELKRIETINQKKILRELSTESLVEDEQGFLRLLITDPEGKETITKPILNVSSIKIQRFWALEYDKNILKISWENNNLQNNSVIVDTGISEKQLARKLRSAGLMFMMPANKKEVIETLLFAFIFAHSEMIEIPSHFGWNLLSTGMWKFSYDIEETMEGMICLIKF